MNIKSIQTEIKRALARSGLSASAASRQATGNASLVKNILNGHIPRADSLIQLADVLGLEFYIGGSRDDENLNKKKFNSEKIANTEPRIWSLGTLPDFQAMQNRLKEFDEWGQNKALNQAQNIIYDAWESEDMLRSVALAFRALELSPLCSDAYSHLADLLPMSLEEKVFLYRLAMDASEIVIGLDRFELDRGDFWEILLTRPYIRARISLAKTLWLQGQKKSAVNNYWDVLALNKNDNMGVRYYLASCLLEMNDEKGLRQLFDLYQDDESTHMLYTRMLIEFRACGDNVETRRLIKEAWLSNPHIPYMLEHAGEDNLELIDSYSIGSEDEAINYCGQFGLAWSQTPGAIEWLTKTTNSPRDDILKFVRDSIRDQTPPNDHISEPPALYEPTEPVTDDVASAHPVSVMELAAAAGGGALDLDERVVGQVWFQRDWLDRKGIDSTQCNIISVKGESMEPTLPDGCSILVDRSRQRRHNGHIFVLLTADGLVVKRLGKDGNGDWQLVSDYSGWEAMAWQRDTAVVGEVMWVARSL